MQKFEFNLFADYFYWSPDGVYRLLGIARGYLAVGTVRNMTVPVTVEIAEREPDEDTGQWHQVNECRRERASRLVGES